MDKMTPVPHPLPIPTFTLCSGISHDSSRQESMLLIPWFWATHGYALVNKIQKWCGTSSKLELQETLHVFSLSLSLSLSLKLLPSHKFNLACWLMKHTWTSLHHYPSPQPIMTSKQSPLADQYLTTDAQCSPWTSCDQKNHPADPSPNCQVTALKTK